MKSEPFKTLITATAQNTVAQYWKADLAQKSNVNCNQTLYLTGSSTAFGVVRAAACLEDEADLSILNQTDFNYGLSEEATGALLIVDLEGSDDDVTLSLEAAKARNMHTVLITSKNNDVNASKADNCITVPAAPDYYDWDAYLAAQIIVLAFAASRAVHTKNMSPERFDALGKGIVDYSSDIAQNINSIADAAQAFAEVSATKSQFDLVADGCMESISEYLRALYCKTAGCLCSVNDSEEWCHVDFWCMNRYDIAAICACPKHAPSFSRFAETMMTVHRLERPYFIITDALSLIHI